MTRNIHRSLHTPAIRLSEMAGKWCTQQNSNLRPLPSENMPTTDLSRFCSLFTVNTARTERESRVVAYTVFATSPGAPL